MRFNAAGDSLAAPEVCLTVILFSALDLTTLLELAFLPCTFECDLASVRDVVAATTIDAGVTIIANKNETHNPREKRRICFLPALP